MRIFRHAVCVALIVSVVSCSRNQPPSSNNENDRRAIADLVASENTGFTSGNVNQLLAVYTDDVVMMPPGEAAILGKDRLRPWLETLLSNNRIGSSTVSESLQIRDDWAIERLSLHSTSTPAAGGTAVADAGKILHVYRRQPDGTWRIAQDIWNSDRPLTGDRPAAVAPPVAPPIAPPPPAAGGSASPAGDPFAATMPGGRIENVQIAADVIAYHQDAKGWSAYRTPGVITRWELPVRIYVDPSVNADNVQRAMAQWQLKAGISYSFISKDAEPRILVRAGSDGLSGSAVARGGIDGTAPNNSARSGLIVIKPELATCDIAEPKCFAIFGKVTAGALGIFDLVPGGITASAPEPSPREINLLRVLYQLPHGAQVKPDGTWTVVK